MGRTSKLRRRPPSTFFVDLSDDAAGVSNDSICGAHEPEPGQHAPVEPPSAVVERGGAARQPSC
eukprot:scaffold287480_cov27-Tisochrysis_lutea.AAC.1